MDASQEAANRAQIKGYRVGIIALIVTIIQAIVPYFVIWLKGGSTVILTGWLPIILLLCSSALSATASIIVSARLFKTKRLTQELDGVKSELSEANTNSQRLKNELAAETQIALTLLKEKGKLERQLASPPDPPKLPPAPKPRLTFEIDEREISQVRLGNGNLEICRINLELKIRCIKESDSVIAVRSFHASLHHLQEDGSERTIVNQEDSQFSRNFTSLEILPAGEMWSIREPDSGFRIYHFVIEITRRLQASLSEDHHFLRVTMNATGQEPLPQDLFVEDWTQPASRISLTRPEKLSPATQTKIRTLKRRLASAEQTNENLGRYHQQFEPLIALTKKQKSEIDNWVKVKCCEQGDLILKPPLGTHYKVMLSIWVINKSKLDISLSNDLSGGFIKFQSTPLRDTKTVASPVMNLSSGETGCLTIEQLLSPSDVQMLFEAQHVIRPQYFNFDELVVNIIGAKDTDEIVAKPLQLGSAYAPAFPINLLERLQRVRALSEIRGTWTQLYEPLRLGNEPLSVEAFRYWQDNSLQTLKKVYTDEAAEALWRQIMHGEPIPNTAPFQRNWLDGCIRILGALLATEAGEYIRNTQNLVTEQHIP